MILVNYYEQKIDPATGGYISVLLGKEAHEDIEEVLLPQSPAIGNPVFITKKFSGNSEYRWELTQVSPQPATATQPQTYDITLFRHSQLYKEEYLANILKGPAKTAQNVLHRFALVEVEYGHAPCVGKVNGDIRSNKRYPETVQSGSMPKRRLAIVNQVISRTRHALVQVVPISSVQPNHGDQSAFEVTNSLSGMVHYQKQSWAICSMIETVAPSRIIAPLVLFGRTMKNRDTGFKQKLLPPERTALENALMYAVASGHRVAESTNLQTAKQTLAQKEQELEQLTRELEALKAQTRYFNTYEQLSREYSDALGRPFDALRDEYDLVYG